MNMRFVSDKNVHKVYRTEKNYPLLTRNKRGFWKSVGNFFKGVASGVGCVISLFTACGTFGGRTGPSRGKPILFYS